MLFVQRFFLMHTCSAQASVAEYTMARWPRTERSPQELDTLLNISNNCVLIYANIGLLTPMVRGKRSAKHIYNLEASIQNVVRATEPDIFCMCEVGSYECTNAGALTQKEMKGICETCCDAWESVTGFRPGCTYQWPHPYLTLYNTNTVEIKKVTIVPTFLACAQTQRFAQTMSCAMHGHQPFDVWNIHNPCPAKPNNLTDKQREKSLDTILRTSSISDTRKRTGEGSVVLGGDMNINYEMMISLMEKLGPPLGLLWCTDRTMIQDAILKPVQVPKNYSSGLQGYTPENSPDFCIACNIHANTISIEVEFPIEPNAHIPYGICIKCDPLPSTLCQEQTNLHSTQQLEAYRRTRRWSQKSHTDGDSCGGKVKIQRM